ncbi:flagellar hook-basal body complex protein FliE [Actinotalea sp. BY-33]|uniref:Flagellar hook-basal body complex protein FliE n=1 Tax=Actinotalea soli TaxID=2819234 RepID=A0A939LMZ6_9CELL|nr:flagellar hook-basal body complex protein FliE [Actinotalea soli]MBO1751257.1 flagellar hook-basal body complex protein FliE [Actinotalea soli]
MSILPVGGVMDAIGAQGALGVQAAPPATGAGTFSLDVGGAIDNLQGMQATSDALAVRAVTGDLDDVHDYTIASSQAAVALELTAAIRNKAVDAFTEIMRMQA